MPLFSFVCGLLSGGLFFQFIVTVFLGLVALILILVRCTVLVLGVSLEGQTSWGTLLVGLVMSRALPSRSFLSTFEAESLFSSLSIFFGLESVWWGVVVWALPCLSFPSALKTKARGPESLAVAALLWLGLVEVSKLILLLLEVRE